MVGPPGLGKELPGARRVIGPRLEGAVIAVAENIKGAGDDLAEAEK